MRGMLLQAGIDLFSEKGYASTSVREIVERAGVTKPVLYYYFKNKEGMLRDILDCASEMQDAILEEVLDQKGTVQERIIHLFHRIYQGVIQNQSLFRFIHNLVFGPPQGTPSYDLKRYQRRMFEVIQTIYLEGVEKGEVRNSDPRDVAAIVMALIDFCLHLDSVNPEISDPQRPERLLHMAFQGLSERNLKSNE